MKKQKGKKKAFLAVLLSAAVICQTFPAYSLAAQGPDGICPHHTEHTAQCGYREVAAEVPCNHQHTEECYKTETNCLHQHTEECYPLVPSDIDETKQVRGNEPTACTHVCSEESGCITKKETCTHVQVNEDGTTTLLHDEKCGYVAAQEASACQFVCEECKNAAAESERLAAEAEKAAQESQQKIDNVQSLISALPETEGITAENLEDVKAQLAEIEAAKAELDENQQASLQMEKYNAAVERVAVVEGELEAERIESQLAAQESQQKIDNVQSLISGLPEAEGITAENLESVKTQLTAIEAAKAALDESQQAALNMEKYNAAVERIAALEAEPQKAPADTQEAGSEPTENDVAAVTIDGVTTYYQDLPSAFSAANGNTATIILLKSLTAEDTAIGGISSGNITLDMNGQTVDSDVAAVMLSGGTLTITGGGWLCGVGGSSKDGTVILESGTIHDIHMDFEGKVIVKGGTIEDIMSQYATIEFEPGNLLLNKDTLSLEAGKSEQLSASVTPTISAPGFGYSWKSSDTAVATVDADGTVTAVAPGEATITVTVGNKAETCTVTVKDYVATVTIDGVEKGYPTLAEAITAANGNTATITLLQSIDETEEASYYDIYGGNITLSLNGCSVGAPLYIKSGNIKVIGEGGLFWISFVTDGIEAVIESGNITNLIASDSSKVTISGGDVEKFTVNPRATAIITGGNIHVLNGSYDGSGNITVKGGTIESITDSVSSINYEVENVTLDQSELSLQVNEQKTLSATVTPNISAPGFPVWESSNEAVATVDADGTVTAVAPGETTITVTAGEKTATCTVTVAEDYVATVTIDGVETYCSTLEETFEIANGNTATIKLLKSIIDEKGEIISHGTISSGVITLDMNGHTLDTPLCSIAVSGGTLIITGSGELDKVGAIPGSSGIVILESGKVGMATPIFEGTFIVRGGTLDSPLSPNATIKFEPGKLLLDKTELSLEAGKFENLTATVEPSISAPGFGYSWESSDTDVATVNNGTVTAVGAGTADITVKAGNKSRICKVTVTEDVASVTIGNQTQNYTNLDDAAKEVSGSSGTLTLLKDVSGRTQPLELSGPMTFDLGGHTLSGAWEDDPYGGLLEITSGVVEVKNGNVSVPGDTGVLCCAIAVREGATLSGNATYSANAWGDVVYNKGTIREGNFHGSCNLYGTVQGGNFHTSSIQMFGKIEGGNFNNTGGNSNLDRPREVGFGPDGVILGGTFTNLKFMYGVNGLFQGGIFNNCVFSSIRDDYFSGETNLAPGYVAYDTSGKIVIDRQPQIKLPPMYFTGTIEPHKSHTYNYTTSEDGNGNYTCSENTCPICGITAPEGAAYTVTIPKTAQLGSDTEVSVNNSLSQEKTVTVSVNEKQVTLTRENDPEQTQIVSDVTFEDISVTKGQTDTEKVTFASPVYNNDPDAVIPAGTYKGTLSFTIGMQ